MLPPGLERRGSNTVGVREVSRLISRIRHRQFGVLVTTSVVGRQAYEEVPRGQASDHFFERQGYCGDTHYKRLQHTGLVKRAFATRISGFGGDIMEAASGGAVAKNAWMVVDEKRARLPSFTVTLLRRA